MVYPYLVYPCLGIGGFRVRLYADRWTRVHVLCVRCVTYMYGYKRTPVLSCTSGIINRSANKRACFENLLRFRILFFNTNNKHDQSINQSIKHSIKKFLSQRQTRKDTSEGFFAPLSPRQKQQKATDARLLLSVCLRTAISYLANFSRLSQFTLLSPLSPRHLSLRLLTRPV